MRRDISRFLFRLIKNCIFELHYFEHGCIFLCLINQLYVHKLVTIQLQILNNQSISLVAENYLFVIPSNKQKCATQDGLSIYLDN